MKDILDNLMNGIKGEINSCILAKIESFDPEKLTANVIPMTRQLDRTGQAKELSMLLNIPVATIQTDHFIIRQPYKKGDIVVMVVADSNIEGTIITGEISDPSDKRKHSLDDGIIVGGFKALNSSLPSDHSEDLIIADKEFNTKIVLKKDGEIIVQGGKVYLGSETAVEGVPLGDTLKEWLDTHKHSYSWTDPAGSGETSVPSVPSPKPSQVVKTI